MRKTTLSLLLLVFQIVLCQAQTSQILFKSLDLEDGLSQNSVVSIAQDSIGYLWFATQDGLNRYDGYDFHKYEKYYWDITKENNVQLGKLHVDHEGILWSLPQSGVPEKYDPVEDKFEVQHNIKNTRCITSDDNGNLYFGTENGLTILNKSETKVSTPYKEGVVSELLLSSDQQIFLVIDGHLWTSKNALDNSNLHFEKVIGISTNAQITNLFEDESGNIWVATFGNGLFRKEKKTSSFSKFDLGFTNLKILSIVKDQQNKIWLGTYGNGVLLLNLNSNSVEQFQPEKHNPNAIAYNDILTIFEDQSNNIWFGTDGGGINYYDKNLVKFNGFTNSQIPSNIQIDVVRSIIVEANKNVWIGTSGKGLTRYAPNLTTKKWHTYTKQNSALNSNRIMSLEHGLNQQLLIGTQGSGLNVYHHKTEKFSSVNHPVLSNATIWDIHRDQENRFWLATRNSGLLEFDPINSTIIPNEKNTPKLQNKNIRCVIDARSTDELWVGMEHDGVALYNKTNGTYTPITSPYGTLKIKSLFLDSNEVLWIGTNGNGLEAYDIKTKKHYQFGKKDGLPNQVIYGILPDQNQQLWLSTNQGLCKFITPASLSDTTKNPSVIVYDNFDGLQSMEFNTGAYFKDESGNFYFGGINGYNWFHPDQINTATLPPKVILTEFSVNEKSMLEKIGRTKNDCLVLKHFQNDVSFSFATNNFSLPEKNKFRYQLIGYDESVHQTNNRHFANYTNLSPGAYTLSIQASNYDGIWNEDTTQFHFRIKPIWYNTLIARLFFILLATLILLGIYFNRRRRWRLKAMLEKEQQHAKHLTEMNEFKNEFYTNITHELRTPLTVIKGMSQEISENEKAKKLITNSTNQLLQLVNQILDLSKLEHGHLNFNYIQQDVVVLLKYIVSSFHSFAQRKNINLVFKSSHPSIIMDIDPKKLQQIISNLIANAIKFSNENDTITLEVNRQNEYLNIQVVDTGIGIDKQHLKHIFERYYQVDPTNKTQIGTGIGLAYVKELMDKMNGKIDVKSKIHKGTTFLLDFIISNNAPLAESKETTPHLAKENTSNNLNTNYKNKPVVLIIEDNTDVSAYLQTILEKTYTIEIQENGQKGIEAALQTIPDLIISDVMMPVMDGLELCDRMKNHELTAHIPVILLTAKASMADKKSGLLKGADAYLIKPFDKEELLIRVDQLLSLRKKMEEYYSKNFEKSTKKELDPFLLKLNESIDKNIGDEHFKTTQLCESVFFSKMQVHRKLKALTGQSTSEYLRNYRLNHALNLLKKGGLSISEVADLSGFSSPAYFSRSFKEVYDMSPSDYMNAYKSID